MHVVEFDEDEGGRVYITKLFVLTRFCHSYLIWMHFLKKHAVESNGGSLILPVLVHF